MEIENIKLFLDQKVKLYNTPVYIETDPIQVPHGFSKKEDVEIAAFLSASIACGQRKTIVQNAWKIMELLDNHPYDFVLNDYMDTAHFKGFVHRTFNADDLKFFVGALHFIYKELGGLEQIFMDGYHQTESIYSALSHFHHTFINAGNKMSNLSTKHRAVKHISDVNKNSAAKRLNMFLRWMVRQDEQNVDLGLWKHIPMSSLMLPLDVHSGNISRQLGLLLRKQNDWKAVLEITDILKEFDPLDPCKYDFALFGIGVFKADLI